MTDSFNFSLARDLARSVTAKLPAITPREAVSSFDEAKRAAWESEFPLAQDWMDALMNTTGYEAKLGWTDLREHMVGRELCGPIYESLVREEPPLIERAFNELRPILSVSEEASEVIDDIVADIYHSVLSRHIHGHSYSFWERVLQVYRDGYWPCGWRGRFPEMEFLVYRFCR